MTPSLVSASTLPSDSSTSTCTQRRRSGAQSRPYYNAGERVKDDRGSDSDSDESRQTTWSSAYGGHIRDRKDLGWYYGNDKE
jgi:hypothetical protein